jgi:predicted TIM-barrel fold metal-dependent hydrolase
MITDVNISLSAWPLRHLPYAQLPQCLAKLQSLGVTQAWVGSFDGLLHKDVGAVNTRLAGDCRRGPSGLLRPFGTVNPRQPDWREELPRCHEGHHMPGIRLHPTYHGYSLEDPACVELLVEAGRREMLVQLVVRVEDPRMQHPLMRVPDLDVRPLTTLLERCPRTKLVLLNALQVLPATLLRDLAATNRVWFDLATLEGMGGIARILETVPLESLLFGSHLPLFLPESALLKLRETELTDEQHTAITCGNAIALCPPP